MSKYDVVIIGAGISGLCAGLYLQKMGKRSIILEHGHQVGGVMAGVWRKGFSIKKENHYQGALPDIRLAFSFRFRLNL